MVELLSSCIGVRSDLIGMSQIYKICNGAPIKVNSWGKFNVFRILPLELCD